MNEKDNGRNIVFFSGGLDSTLVSVQLLRAGKHVTLVNFDNSVIGSEHQQNLEKLAMKKIIKKMKTEFGDDMVMVNNYTWDGDMFVNTQNDIWVSLFPLCLMDNDIVHFPIIRHSDFWHSRTEFESAFNSILEYHKKKGVQLLYPLEWKHKKDIVKELRKVGYHDLSIHSGDKL